MPGAVEKGSGNTVYISAGEFVCPEVSVGVARRGFSFVGVGRGRVRKEEEEAENENEAEPATVLVVNVTTVMFEMPADASTYLVLRRLQILLNIARASVVVGVGSFN